MQLCRMKFLGLNGDLKGLVLKKSESQPAG